LPKAALNPNSLIKLISLSKMAFCVSINLVQQGLVDSYASKHKTSLIEGDSNMLYDISQQHLLNDIVATIDAASLKIEYLRFKNRKMEIEKIQRKLRKELKDIKNDLAKKLQNGIKI
jgi:hypothetical protein